MSTRFFLLLLNLPLLLIRAEVIRFHASTDGEGFVFLGRSRLLGFKKSIWTFRSRDGWFQQKRYQSKAEAYITGLPGIRCSVFTASPDVSDFFLPKIGQKCQIGDFWGYSGPNLATLWKSVSHFQFGGNLAFLGPKLTDFKVLPDLDVNFPQKSLILAFLADFWWFWIRIIWQRCGNSQNL